MYSKCCVPGCLSSRMEAVLHKFPKCEKRLQMWLKSINCDSLRNKSVKMLQGLQVCHKHFEARFVTQNSRLRAQAYPTLFLQSEILSGIPRRSLSSETHIGDHEYVRRKHIDHNYCLQESLVQNEMDVLAALPSTSANLIIMDETLQLPVVLSPETTASAVGKVAQDMLEATPQYLDPRKKRLKVEALTPKCRKLYNEYRKSKKMISFTRRAKKALQFGKSHSFEELVSGMKPLAKKMLMMQVRLCTKKEKARRFTLEEKLISLSILKQGPKSYQFLQKIFILPSATTLKKLISNFQIHSGINVQIFDAIKDEVKNWKEEKKLCSIIFDEMALETNLTYTHQDEIRGFVELPEKKKKFADHALVFMVKGLVHKWQQPIAYYFCEGATTAIQLKEIIKELVKAIGESGLIPLAIVSDQGASFQSALKNLQDETRRSQILQNKITDDTIILSGFTMNVVYDPPHLIKGLRNNFLSKNISFNGKICSWQDIVDVYKTDCQHAESRLLHKLHDELVIPEKIKKMKVKNCVRVFSKTVAGALNFTAAFSHYADGKEVSKTMKNTAEVVSFCNDLFDSVNGTAKFTKKNKGNELRRAVTENSVHHAFWQEAILKLSNFKFISQNGDEKSVPTIKNWICTLKSMQRLWQVLKQKKTKIMRPRYINSDAIENFFGKVRAYNSRNNNPTCHNFVSTFKSLLITGFIKFHDPSFNCEKEENNPLIKMKSLFQSKQAEVPATVGGDKVNESCIRACPDLREVRLERITIQSRAYTAGWVVRKILKNIKCKYCLNNLTTKKASEVHKWIRQREFKCNTQKLTYPAEHIVRYFGMILENTNLFLENHPHVCNISKTIKEIVLKKNQFEAISCQTHRSNIIQALLDLSIKLCIHNWCSVINKILKGTDIVRLENRRVLPEMQRTALTKFKKKLKKNNK